MRLTDEERAVVKGFALGEMHYGVSALTAVERGIEWLRKSRQVEKVLDIVQVCEICLTPTTHLHSHVCTENFMRSEAGRSPSQ